MAHVLVFHRIWASRAKQRSISRILPYPPSEMQRIFHNQSWLHKWNAKIVLLRFMVCVNHKVVIFSPFMEIQSLFLPTEERIDQP